MNQIYDYILDFDVKVIDPPYIIKIFCYGRLVRKIGCYQVMYKDMQGAYLLTMKLENLNSEDGELILNWGSSLHSGVLGTEYEIKYKGTDFL